MATRKRTTVAPAATTHTTKTAAVSTWTKLKSGRWGVRVPSGTTAPQGENPVVTVTKRDGTTAQVVLGSCLWHGDTASLWTAEAVVGQERKTSKATSAGKGAGAGKTRTRKAA